MWRMILTGAAVLMVLGSTQVFAQQSAASGGRQHQHWRLGQVDLNAFTDARVAALRAGLPLTPDLEKN